MIRILYSWYTEFSKIAHFGELTIRQIAIRYNQSNEEQVYNNYSYLLITITKYIVALLAKVLYDDPLEEEIILDFEEVLEFENGI